MPSPDIFLGSTSVRSGRPSLVMRKGLTAPISVDLFTRISSPSLLPVICSTLPSAEVLAL